MVSPKEATSKGAANIAGAASKLAPGLRLAERLREARKEKGFSLETASQRSKVALRYVCMLEDGRYPMVADPTYLTYFVRRYAACLGLDGRKASDDFIAEIEGSAAPLDVNGSRRAEVSTAGRRSRLRLFKAYAVPLSLITSVLTVGLLSLLNLWIDKARSSVSMPESHGQPSSAIVIPASAEASHAADLAAASPPLASVATAEKVGVADVSAIDSQPVDSNLRTSAAEANSSQPGTRQRLMVSRSQSSTNKASDTLREEQRVRTRAAAARVGQGLNPNAGPR